MPVHPDVEMLTRPHVHTATRIPRSKKTIASSIVRRAVWTLQGEYRASRLHATCHAGPRTNQLPVRIRAVRQLLSVLDPSSSARQSLVLS